MDLLKQIKKSAVQAVEQTIPADTLIGIVKTVNPLSITINQRLDIPADFLLLTDNVRDHQVTIELEEFTEYETAASDSHRHEITGEKTITIKKGLAVGEKVILQMAKGGQRYIILNRVVEA